MIAFFVGWGCLMIGMIAGEAISLYHIDKHLTGKEFCPKCEVIWPGSGNLIQTRNDDLIRGLGLSIKEE